VSQDITHEKLIKMGIKKYTVLILILAGIVADLDACTIFSGKDNKGQVWAGNNEDLYFTFNSYLNLVAPTDSTFGYSWFTFFSLDGAVQGGVNEAGLFFDGNAVKPSMVKDYDKKIEFPGGSRQLFHHVLKKCKTVEEVFTIFRKFRLRGLEAAQIHLADKYGNFGIIVADSMWITKSNHQVSTNYNLCHPDKDGITCWRFPIAEGILSAKEPGLESFREICDSTCRRTKYSTVYSNIHNLTTGDIWFYYGMNYTKAYKTNIKELLKKGTRSFFLHELFPDEPLVNLYKTYQSEGVEKCLNELKYSSIQPDRKVEILRLMSSDLIFFKRDFDGYPILQTLIQSEKIPDEFNHVLNAISLFCTGRKEEAPDVLKKYINMNPKSTLAKVLLNQMQGAFDERANTTFVLKGYPDAQNVIVDGISISPIYYFLVREGDQWVGKFRLPPTEYHYSFYVDGIRILDPENKDVVVDAGIECNRLIVEN
jgi:hypothetical protein